MPELGSIDDVGPKDLHAVDRICIRIGIQTADFIQCGEPGDYDAEDGVLSVLGGYGLEANIKLTAIRLPVGVDTVLQPARGDGTAKMFPPNFGRQCVTGTAGPGHSAVVLSGQGIAALDQIIWEHSVNGGLF